MWNLRGGGIVNRKEPQIWMTNYKLHVDFPLCQELAPLTPGLFQESTVYME